MIEKANVSHAIKFRTSLGSRNFSLSKISNFFVYQRCTDIKRCLMDRIYRFICSYFRLIFIQQSTDRESFKQLTLCCLALTFINMNLLCMIRFCTFLNFVSNFSAKERSKSQKLFSLKL